MNGENSFYVVDGERVPLRPVDSARLVVPARNHSMGHVAARLARSTRLGIDTSAPNNFLVVRGDPEKFVEVDAYDDISSARSAFTDPYGHELFLTDEVLVGFVDDMADGDRRMLCEEMECNIVDDSGDVWRLVVRDPLGDAPLNAANQLSSHQGVTYAEPNALVMANFTAALAPADPLFDRQWHLNNTGRNGGKAGADVRALDAWKITRGSPDIRVVVHDTGVDIAHPDLMANLNPGWDFDNDDADPSNDSRPHGTACAGVIAAVANGEGVVGVAPDCRIVPLRGTSMLFDRWAATFRWAAQHGDIISCSWSIPKSNVLSEAIQEVAKQGRDGKGTPIFFATANGFVSSIDYPASLPETIAVGASTNQDVRAAYSQYGDGIDFVAPSSGGTLRIETTDVTGPNGYGNGDYCKADDSTGFGGTSSATPLAAGVAALMLSVNNDLTAEEVRHIMRETSEKIDAANANYNAAGWSREYGYGRINAAEAVAEAKRRAYPAPNGKVQKAVTSVLEVSGIGRIRADILREHRIETLEEFAATAADAKQIDLLADALNVSEKTIAQWRQEAEQLIGERV